MGPLLLLLPPPRVDHHSSLEALQETRRLLPLLHLELEEQEEAVGEGQWRRSPE